MDFRRLPDTALAGLNLPGKPGLGFINTFGVGEIFTAQGNRLKERSILGVGQGGKAQTDESCRPDRETMIDECFHLVF